VVTRAAMAGPSARPTAPSTARQRPQGCAA